MKRAAHIKDCIAALEFRQDLLKLPHTKGREVFNDFSILHTCTYIYIYISLHTFLYIHTFLHEFVYACTNYGYTTETIYTNETI